MKKRLLDILACPIDKFYPLELFELNTRKSNGSDREKEELTIEEGILYCSKCNRFYPIIDEIPIMLPDELRDKQKNQDIEFLRKWQNKIPEKVIRQGNPWHL